MDARPRISRSNKLLMIVQGTEVTPKITPDIVAKQKRRNDFEKKYNQRVAKLGNTVRPTVDLERFADGLAASIENFKRSKNAKICL